MSYTDTANNENMYQGNWKCSSCGGAITELPFQPRSEAGLTCRDCFFKKKNGTGGNAGDELSPAPEDTMTGGAEAPPIPDDAGFASEPPPPADFDGATDTTPGDKPKFEGDWRCADCNNPITSLPFQPRSTENLRCLDCFKKSRA